VGKSSDADPQAILWLKFGIAILLSGLTMYLSLGANLGKPQDTARTLIHATLISVSAGVMLGLGWPIFRSGWRDLIDGKITLEHAFLIGILGSFGASVYSSVTGEGAIYYEVVVILTAIYLFGRNITERQIHRQTDMAHAIPGLGKTATVSSGETTTEVPIVQLVAGQLVIIREGGTIPIDGVIQSGRAYIERQAHTGETYPVPADPGTEVMAGSVVLDGTITIKATTDGNNREIDRLLASLTTCTASATKVETLAARVLAIFVPVVLTIALLTGILWTLAGHPREGWLNALTVTVVACPCALGVAIPLAIRRGRMDLGMLGIIPMQADFIDRLAEADMLAFDKTGTLSHPTLELASFEIQPDAPAELLDQIIAIQKRSSHPVARPFWKLEGTKNASPVQEIQIKNLPGRGIEVSLKHREKERTLRIGNRHLLDEMSISNPDRSQDRALYVVAANRIVAIARLEESARTTSVATLKKLQENGYDIAILTGDSTVPKDYRSETITVMAGLSSADKAKWIRNRNATHRLLYIGDGLNDCESFQHAHASIALESGNSAAQSIAQSLLLHDDLAVIPTALSQVRELRRRLNRILRFSFGFNTLGIGLAAAGLLHPVVAAVLMFASSLFVIACIGSNTRNPSRPSNSTDKEVLSPTCQGLVEDEGD
jgi:cation transport ATPase